VTTGQLLVTLIAGVGWGAFAFGALLIFEKPMLRAWHRIKRALFREHRSHRHLARR
jgi:hypothetical protein